jgi:hypothetical protein
MHQARPGDELAGGGQIAQEDAIHQVPRHVAMGGDRILTRDVAAPVPHGDGHDESEQHAVCAIHSMARRWVGRCLLGRHD